METEGQNRTLGYGKWVKIQPLTLENITKLTTFEAILHAEIDQIWPLATEPQPKLDHWLQKSSQK